MVDYSIFWSIVTNAKRVEKIKNAPLGKHYDRRSSMVDKAEAFVVAECQRQHVRLSKDDMFDTAFHIYYKVCVER